MPVCAALFSTRLPQGHSRWGLGGVLLLACLVGSARPGWALHDLEQRAGLEMQYYLTQDNRYSKSPWLPGYRLGFFYDNEWPLNNYFALVFESGATTLISRGDTSAFLMDRIHYRLAPGLKTRVGDHEVSGQFSHECLHAADRKLPGGVVFWNLVSVNAGSAGAYEHNLAARAASRSAPSRHALDYRLGVGTFLRGNSSKYIAQNQDYRRHAQTLVRYNLAVRDRPFLFADWRQDFWTAAEVPRPPQLRRQYKGTTQVNWVIPTRQGMGVVFTEYTYHDQSPFLNEHSLWSLGVKFQH